MYFVQGAVRFPGAVGGMASCFLFLLIFSKWPLKDLKHYPRGRCEAMLAGAAFLIPRIFPLIFWHLAGEVQGCWDRRILLGIRIGGRIYFLSELFLLNMYVYIYKFCLLKRLCIQHCSLFLPPPPPPAVPIPSLSLSQQPKKMQAPRAVSWSAIKQRYSILCLWDSEPQLVGGYGLSWAGPKCSCLLQWKLPGGCEANRLLEKWSAEAGALVPFLS